MNYLKPFAFKLSLITIVLALISALSFYLLPDSLNTKAWPFVLLFLYATNIALFSLFLRAQQKKLSTYANFFMLTTFLKLLVYLIIIIVYLLFNKEEAPAFLLSFFIYYTVFTIIEVKSVLKIQKKSINQNDNNQNF